MNKTGQLCLLLVLVTAQSCCSPPSRLKSMSLEELRAEHERGHVHTAWFKDATDGRFYAICNCCSCCCAGLEAMILHGVPMIASSGYVSRVSGDLCVACGECIEVCPFGALALSGSSVDVDWQRCMGCGICVDKCPAGAISLVLDERKGVPLDVRTL